jgi:hypothetical protein
MARQYYNTETTDSLITTITTAPATTATSLFSPVQAQVCFPIPVGLYGGLVPYAGQIYEFCFGGILTTPASGTLTVTPYFGPGTSTTAFGTIMGASASQTMTVSITNQPFRVKGNICFSLISSASTSSKAWLTGTFQSQGTLATAGSGWVIAFGSTAAISVDTTGLATTGLFGSLNFVVTATTTGSSFSVAYTSMISLN